MVKPVFLKAVVKGSAQPLHAMRGVVVHGDARGRKIGFPTANIIVPASTMNDGVWAASVELEHGPGAMTYAAAVSLGTRPTHYPDGPRLLEVHLLDFAGILYGQVLQVNLHLYIREQYRFQNDDDLIQQIAKDVSEVRSWWWKFGSTTTPEALSS